MAGEEETSHSSEYYTRPGNVRPELGPLTPPARRERGRPVARWSRGSGQSACELPRHSVCVNELHLQAILGLVFLMKRSYYIYLNFMAFGKGRKGHRPSAN